MTEKPAIIPLILVPFIKRFRVSSWFSYGVIITPANSPSISCLSLSAVLPPSSKGQTASFVSICRHSACKSPLIAIGVCQATAKTANLLMSDSESPMLSAPAGEQVSLSRMPDVRQCRVHDCETPLSSAILNNSHRVKLCWKHQRALVVECGNGRVMRFCQQCTRLHTLDRFDGDKRGCRESLARQNSRRQSLIQAILRSLLGEWFVCKWRCKYTEPDWARQAEP
jgi:hypothetical protein